VQYGLAEYLTDPTPYLDLPAFYQKKRELFRAGLAHTKFQILQSQGSYFQCVNIENVPQADGLSDADFCQWLTTELGVAAIPLSAFYGDRFDQRVIRFCFAKKDETLQLALSRLAKL
jgi:methionine aminotransferase